jgi:hypothetical protein
MPSVCAQHVAKFHHSIVSRNHQSQHTSCRPWGLALATTMVPDKANNLNVVSHWHMRPGPQALWRLYTVTSMFTGLAKRCC